MLSQNEIRQKLNSFILNELSLGEFEDWIAANSWNMHLNSDRESQVLASAIELRLAEYSSGHLPCEQMIEEFRSLLAGMFVLNVRLNADPVICMTGASITVVEAARSLAPFAEKRPLMVFA